MLVKAECFQKIVNIQRIIAEICSDFNVFLDIKVRYEVIHLKNISQMLSAVKSKSLFVHVLGLFAVDLDIAAVSIVNSADNVEQRGLTRT